MSTNNSESSPTLQQTAQQTAQAFGPNAAKLEVAEKAVFLDDMRRLGAQERDTVARYKEMKVFGTDPGQRREDDMGHIIIGDIYGDAAHSVFGTKTEKIEQVTSGPTLQPAQTATKPKSRLPAAALAAALGLSGLGAGAGLASLLANRPTTPVIVPGNSGTDTDTDTLNEYQVGFGTPIRKE